MNKMIIKIPKNVASTSWLHHLLLASAWGVNLFAHHKRTNCYCYCIIIHYSNPPKTKFPSISQLSLAFATTTTLTTKRFADWVNVKGEGCELNWINNVSIKAPLYFDSKTRHEIFIGLQYFVYKSGVLMNGNEHEEQNNNPATIYIIPNKRQPLEKTTCA